jgi:hypothetical protein
MDLQIFEKEKSKESPQEEVKDNDAVEGPVKGQEKEKTVQGI